MSKLTVIFENDFGFKATVQYEGFAESEISEYLHSDDVLHGLGFSVNKEKNDE